MEDGSAEHDASARHEALIALIEDVRLCFAEEAAAIVRREEMRFDVPSGGVATPTDGRDERAPGVVRARHVHTLNGSDAKRPRLLTARDAHRARSVAKHGSDPPV